MTEASNLKNLAPFICVKVLGTGKYGRVWLCRDKRNSDFEFVLKQQMASDNFKSARNEVEMLKKMLHPNIILFFGYAEKNVIPYESSIYMEYARGGNLLQFLKSLAGSPVPEDKAMLIFSQITLGVHHMHTRKVIHRDIKHLNIMFRRPHEIYVKIIDLGFAKCIEKEKPKSRLGTPSFIAPEIDGINFYDEKCDIWSMGIVLYEMLTNRRALKDETQEFCIHPIDEKLIDDLPDTISPEVRGLNYSMLYRDPTSRPSADQLVTSPPVAKSIQIVYTPKTFAYIPKPGI